MAKYFAGTRLALYGKTSQSVIYQTTVGSPVRFDASIVSGCIQIPAALNGNIQEGFTLPLGIDGITASTLVIKFDWLSGNNTTQYEPQYTFVEFLDASLNSIVRLSQFGFTGAFIFEYYNGSTYIQTGPTLNTPSSAGKTELQIRIVTGSSGSIQFWKNGAIDLDVSSIPFSRTGPIKFVRIKNPWTLPSYISQIAISDFDMRGYKISSDALNATGTFNDGAGAPADTGDLNFNTSKSLPANLNKYSGTHATRVIPGNLTIESVTMASIMRAGSPVTNARSIMVVSGTSYSASGNISPPPANGYEWRGQDWTAHPTLGAWTAENYNAAEKGHEART